MKNDIREKAVSKSLSAYVVLNRKGVYVAKVLVHHGDSRVTVNIWSNSDKDENYQQGTASGYGYDKKTAALSGLTIDGHPLNDHCGMSLKRPKKGYFEEGFKAPKGYHFANYSAIKDGKAVYGEEKNDSNVVWGYTDCYRESGLKYLEALGYQVIFVM